MGQFHSVAICPKVHEEQARLVVEHMVMQGRDLNSVGARQVATETRLRQIMPLTTGGRPLASLTKSICCNWHRLRPRVQDRLMARPKGSSSQGAEERYITGYGWLLAHWAHRANGRGTRHRRCKR
jgi:hypothetical protein